MKNRKLAELEKNTGLKVQEIFDSPDVRRKMVRYKVYRDKMARTYVLANLDVHALAETLWKFVGHFTDHDHELRCKWLAAAGWDPGGWALQNWHELPKELQADLRRTIEEAHKVMDEIIERNTRGFNK